MRCGSHSKGKSFSAEHRAKLSSSTSNVWSDPIQRELRSEQIRAVGYEKLSSGGRKNRGKIKSEEHRRKLSDATKRQWAEGRVNLSVCGDTTLERGVMELLDSERIEYATQQRVGRFIVDFLLSDGTVVEANGCYWHSCQSCGHSDPNGRRDSDRLRTLELESMGHPVLVIWEHELQEGRWSGHVQDRIGSLRAAGDVVRRERAVPGGHL